MAFPYIEHSVRSAILSKDHIGTRQLSFLVDYKILDQKRVPTGTTVNIWSQIKTAQGVSVLQWRTPHTITLLAGSRTIGATGNTTLPEDSLILETFVWDLENNALSTKTTTILNVTSSALRAPLAPFNVSARLVGGEVDMSWIGSSNALHYRIDKKVDDGQWTLLAKEITALEYTDKQVEPGHKYSYRVYAENAFGSSPASGESSLLYPAATPTPTPTPTPTTGAPGAPNVSIFSDADSIDLAWVPLSNAKFYRIERKPDFGSYTTLVSNHPFGAYIDKTPGPDITYTYRVFAVNDSGESPPSNEVNGRLTRTIQPLPGIPGAPRITATPTTGSIILQWLAVSGAKSYRIERKPDFGNYVTLVSNHPIGYFEDRTPGPDITYTYRVFAVNDSGESSPSNEASAKITTTIQPPPSFDLSNVEGIILSLSKQLVDQAAQSASATNDLLTKLFADLQERTDKALKDQGENFAQFWQVFQTNFSKLFELTEDQLVERELAKLRAMQKLAARAKEEGLI